MTPEEAREFWDRYMESKRKALDYPEFDPKIESFPKYVERYFKEVELPEPKEKRSVAEIFGLSLFRKISGFFTLMWENVFTAFYRALDKIVAKIFTLVWKEAVEKHTPGIKDYFRKRIATLELPESVEKELTERLEDETPLGHFALFLFGILVTGGKFLSILTAVHDVGRQEGYSELQPSLPGLADIFTAGFRDPKYEPMLDDYMKRMGFNVIVRDMLKLARWVLLNPDQIRQLYLRGKLSKIEKNTMLKALGIREEDLDKLEELYYFIPSPTDLVRMAVREAFYPEYIAKYNLLLEIPSEFIAWSKKQGMSKDWAEKFWVAHWVLPTIGQGYEMLHRGVISKSDLDSLFKAVDIAPYWRSKLLAISYSPYTRIDIRRMYRTGVVDRAEVKKTYLALGYDDEHAENLTEFTVRDALASEKDLSRADITGAYQRKLIPRGDAKSLIMQLGYSDDESEIYLKRADFDTFKKDKDKKLSWIKKNYLAGLITHSEASSRLGKLALRGGEVSELFRDWDIEKEGKMTELTFKQLQVLLIEKIIDEAVFKSELKNKGYSDKYIEWLMQLTKKKVVEGE